MKAKPIPTGDKFFEAMDIVGAIHPLDLSLLKTYDENPPTSEREKLLLQAFLTLGEYRASWERRATISSNIRYLLEQVLKETEYLELKEVEYCFAGAVDRVVEQLRKEVNLPDLKEKE